MNTEIFPELRYFLASFICGACLFAVYDGILILRGIIKHFQLVIWIEDLIYWVGAAIFIFAMMYQMNNGTIRAYAIIGVILGMLIYRVLFGHWLAAIIIKFLRFIIGLVAKILLFILSPVFFILKKIHKFYLLLSRKFCNSAKGIEKKVQKKLQNHQEKVKIKKDKKITNKKLKQAAEKPIEEKPKKGCLEPILSPLEKGEL